MYTEEELRSFNKYVDIVREYHRLAQQPNGLEEVVEQIGRITINQRLIPANGYRLVPSYDNAVLLAIAEAVIPDSYVWEFDVPMGCTGSFRFVGMR